MPKLTKNRIDMISIQCNLPYSGVLDKNLKDFPDGIHVWLTRRARHLRQVSFICLSKSYTLSLASKKRMNQALLLIQSGSAWLDPGVPSFHTRSLLFHHRVAIFVFPVVWRKTEMILWSTLPSERRRRK